MTLVDRVKEKAVLAEVLDAARAGGSGVLVLHGAAGNGKTALLDHAADTAADMQVVRVSGVQSEMELAYAGLHRLLTPFLGARERLPVPQRDALDTAFGLMPANPPARLMVGLAALSLLAGAASRRPVLCVVDDGQWFDRESLQALAFAARRLVADKVAVLIAVRNLADVRDPLDQLSSLHVQGLAEADGITLLRQVVSGPLDIGVAKRIVLETAGSPMAIRELAGGLSSEQLAGGGLLPEPLPVSGRLETHFLQQIRLLPPATQTFLLLAAAEPSDDPAIVIDAAAALGLPPDAAEPAQAEGLIALRPHVQFRHPLIRSAVYGHASSVERRRVHAALAGLLTAKRDEERRAWHRAAAVLGPDEEVATDLEKAAARARLRGGLSATAAFLTRAAELTGERTRRADLTLAAAQANLQAGAPTEARALLVTTAGSFEDPLHQALALRLHGQIGYALGETSGTVSTLVTAAHALQPLDVRLARDTMLDALGATLVGGRLASRDEIWFEVARAAQALPLAPDARATLVDVFIEGLVMLFLKGHRAGAPALRRAIDALDLDRESPEMLRMLGCGCWVAGALGDDQRLYEVAFRVEKLARDQGALVALANALIFLGLAELSAGSLVEADTYFAQSSAIADDRRRPSGVGEVMVAAWRGHEDARQQAAAAARDATERGQGWALPFVEYSVTVWELGNGSYEAALESAPKRYWDNPFFDSIATPELVEAAVRGGDPALAREKVASFSERALTNGTPLALGQLARVRALVAADNEAEALYRRAISLLNQSRSVSQLARTRLLYGEWLRRANRRVDAREQLRTAEEMFAAMGAVGFARRARSELAATGEHARKRTVDTMGDLTPQETRVARLASQGATNAEIGARLFISSNTVDYHLRKVYRKLSVTSRRQLARALAG